MAGIWSGFLCVLSLSPHRWFWNPFTCRCHALFSAAHIRFNIFSIFKICEVLSILASEHFELLENSFFILFPRCLCRLAFPPAGNPFAPDPHWRVCGEVALRLCFAVCWWLVMLIVTCWPFVCLLWENACSGPLPVLNWIIWFIAIESCELFIYVGY